MTADPHDLDDIERELGDRRGALADTLEALAGRLSVDGLSEEALALCRVYGRRAGRRLRRAARDRPTDLALAGAGLALLAYGGGRALRGSEGGHRRGRGSAAQEAVRARSAAARDLAEELGIDLRETAEALGSEAGERLDAARDSVRDTAEKTADKARKSARSARRRAKAAGAEAETFARENPMLIGLGAAALGIATGALVPRDRRRRAGARLREDAQALYEEERERLVDALRDAVAEGRLAAADRLDPETRRRARRNGRV